jgi:hypothetical protein
VQPADRAWVALAAGVLAWDVVCPPQQMLSQASARYKAAHPIAWQATIVYVAGHLAHVWPQRYDPLSRLATAFGR